MYLVAVVGRPNVGKSTLFNRIIQRREAIVEDTPGVTRDRIYSEAEWNGTRFTIIDTGGIVPNSEDTIEKAIREQAQIAIEEADSIVFVCDAKDGVTATDRDIASILRKAKKRITLAINKCDNPALDLAAHEFYQLGLGEPFSISGLNGRSTGDFLDEVTKDFAKNYDEPEDSRLKIALVGRPNVGKSSITNALLGKERSIVTEIAGTTRDAVDSILKYYGEEILLIDTAGLRKKSKIEENLEMYSTMRTGRAIERCDVAVVVLDATRGLELQDKRIIGDVIDARKGIIIAVNKWDLVEKETNTAANFTKQVHEELRTYDYAPVMYISARTKQRVTKIIELAKEIQVRRLHRSTTAFLNDALLEDIDRTPPPAIKGNSLRINYITQTNTAPPVFAFFSNHPEDIPDSYKRFLERSLRKHVELEGVPVSFIFRKKNRRRDE